MKEILYLNGKLIPRTQAKLSPFNFGFLYGYGVFETMRAYNGSVFRLDSHLARLHAAAKTLGIANELSAFDLEKACLDVLKANKLSNARLRLTLTLGEGDIIPSPDTCSGITVFIDGRKLTPIPSKPYRMGYKAILSSSRRNSRSPLSRLKSTSYLENFLARQEAKDAGVDETVFLNERGFVCEGSRTNIFLMSCQMLITPSIESGALPGITRDVVLELAKSLGITTLVKQAELGELFTASEAFLTSSTIEVMPLTRLDNKPVGSGKPGPVTKLIMSSYHKLVADKAGK